MRTKLLVGSFAGALLLAACGGSSGGGDTPSADPTTPEQTETTTQGPSDAQPAFLAENTCPDELTEKDGMALAILDGDEFAITGTSMDYINASCPDTARSAG